MTNADLLALAARKEQLVERCAVQRRQAERTCHHWAERAQTAGKAARFLRHPAVLGLLGVLAVKLPLRRVPQVAGWAWSAWKAVKLFRQFRA